MLNQLLEQIKGWFADEKGGLQDHDREEAYRPREKALVFGLSLLLACCLWFIVNLSRDFSITIDLPLEIEHHSDETALVQDPPGVVQVGLTAEGWNLISLYRNPPRLTVESEEEEVNLFEVVQQRLSILSDVNVTQVRPSRIQLELEPVSTKEVVVIPNARIVPRDRYQLLGDPVSSPERVTIRGAGSVVESVDTLYSESILLQEVNQSGEIRIPILVPESGIDLSESEIRVQYEVAEFTEGEITIPVRIRNLPGSEQIRYQPSTVTVRFDVPIEQYNAVRDARPFQAVIDYADLRSDTTGFLRPEVEVVEGEWVIRVRQVRPARIRYFRIVEP